MFFIFYANKKTFFIVFLWNSALKCTDTILSMKWVTCSSLSPTISIIPMLPKPIGAAACPCLGSLSMCSTSAGTSRCRSEVENSSFECKLVSGPSVPHLIFIDVSIARIISCKFSQSQLNLKTGVLHQGRLYVEGLC